MPSPLVFIPARLASTRLPNKPLAEIHGRPMIVHVWQRALEADIGRVVVATDSKEIAEVVRQSGGEVVMTREDHPSGSDRIAEALLAVDAEGRHDVIVNVQGDLPTIDPASIRACLVPLADADVSIATLVTPITDPDERTLPSVVKAVATQVGPKRYRALYFTRSPAPWGEGPLLHHIGLYAYRRDSLLRFVRLPPSPLELREKLEQLRALEAGMRIDAMQVDCVPLGVDTAADLEKARVLLAPSFA